VFGLALLLGSTLLAIGLPESQSTPEDLAAYHAAAARIGDDAEAHVRLALWCEAHNLRAEREEHLAAALRIAPDDPRARGLVGQVAENGRWERPEQVAARVRADSELAAKLVNYNAKRSKSAMTQEAQWKLALWCQQQGLEPEAVAHFAAVTRIPPPRRKGLDALVQDPYRDLRDAAWKKLGCRLHQGRWMTEEQIHAEREEAAAQARADRRWSKLLEDWKRDLHAGSHREEAEANLAGVTDPRAAREVWRVFAGGGPADQARAAQILGQIDAPAASQGLVKLAVFSSSPEVRRLATETLRGRDPREFVGDLIGLIHEPIRYEVQPVDRPGHRPDRGRG